MKWYDAEGREIERKSLPVRGAWVEITYYIADGYKRQSLPVRGAWVEI